MLDSQRQTHEDVSGMGMGSGCQASTVSNKRSRLSLSGLMHLGPVAGIGLAAVMYGLYHFGYGMGSEEIVFLAGLGVVYAVAFRATRNLLVLWPLLTPLGSLFNNLEGGDIVVPWASMAGFGQVLIAMFLVLWIGHRYWVRHAQLLLGEGVGVGSTTPEANHRVPAGVRE